MKLAALKVLGQLAGLLNRVGLGSLVRVGRRVLARSSPVVIKRYGLTLQASLESHRVLHRLRAGAYDYEVALLRSVLKPNMTVVDVGANVGLYTLVAAQAVGRKGRVVAFEPDPRAIKDLRANVEANGFSNITVVEAAASSARGTRDFYLRHASGHSGLYQDESIDNKIAVPLVSIDETISGSVDLVKIDSQGAEVEVLAGMSATLRLNPEIRVLIEFYPRGLEAAGHSGEELADLLRSCFDKIAWIDSEAHTLRTVQEIELASGRTFGNLYCEGRAR